MATDTTPAIERAARARWNAATRQPWMRIEDSDEWPSWVDLPTRDRLREDTHVEVAAALSGDEMECVVDQHMHCRLEYRYDNDRRVSERILNCGLPFPDLGPTASFKAAHIADALREALLGGRQEHGEPTQHDPHPCGNPSCDC